MRRASRSQRIVPYPALQGLGLEWASVASEPETVRQRSSPVRTASERMRPVDPRSSASSGSRGSADASCAFARVPSPRAHAPQDHLLPQVRGAEESRPASSPEMPAAEVRKEPSQVVWVQKSDSASGSVPASLLQASLVAASLKKVCSDGRKDVAVETIQTWPARVVDGLFDAAKELSALNEEEEDENEKSKENDENDEAESEKND